MDDQTLINANRILIRFVTDIDSKVRYGERQRQEMHTAIGRGEEPKGYRVEFIIQTANAIFPWLAAKAEEFNTKYPQDRISTNDLADILATAHSRLLAKTSGKR